MGEKQDDTNSLSGNYADLNWNLDPVVLQNTGIKPKKKRTIGQKILIGIAILAGCVILGLCMIPVIKMYNKSKVKDDYYDTYVMVKLVDEYETYLNPIIGEYFDDYKFYMEFFSEWVTSNLPPDTKVEDLWNMQAGNDYPIPDLFIYVAPDQTVDEEKVQEVCEKLKKAGLRGCVMIWGVKDKERYQRMSRNDWADNKQYKDFKDIYTIFLYSDRVEISEYGRNKE